MEHEAIRVLLADTDHERSAYLRGLMAESATPFEVAGARALDEAVDVLMERPVDVILADLTLTDSAGLPTLAILLTYAGNAPVVVLSDTVDDPVPLRALQQGAHDQLPRDQLYPMPVIRTIRYAVEQSLARRALQESEERYRALFQQSRDAIYLADADHRLVELNRAALELFEYRAEELVGQELKVLLADEADHFALVEHLRAAGSVRDLELRMRTKTGRLLWCLVAATLREPHGAGASGAGASSPAGSQGIIHDITARKEAELRLEHSALHDRVTGLANRVLLMDRLEQAYLRWARHAEPSFALLFLDLDRFKGVNDTLGHDAGDRVLRRTAGLLRSCVRATDTVCRLGGDEFVVLLEGLDAAAQVVQIAERMLRLLERPYRLAGREFYTTASIGITWPSDRTTRPAGLIREADQAMHRAKAGGGGRYALFDPDLHQATISRLELESDLRQAIGRGEFVLLYQPIISVTTARTTGFEALIRWNHPQRGTLAPGDFIPLAEETGLIVPVSLWAVREAARQLRRWRDARQVGDDVAVSVNLSPRHFLEPDLVQQITRIIDEEGVPADRIMVELTESALMHDPDEAAFKLVRLRELGIRVCLDDFGTGYSSLDHLRRFPLDILKVDRSFIGRVLSPRDLALVGSITSLARNLGMNSIVEGVETADQLARVRPLEPQEVQGFLFARPLEPDSAAAFAHNAVRDLEQR